MSTTTTNYKLHKPELTDAADITKMNPNWDKIDEVLTLLSELSDMVPIENGGTGSKTLNGAVRNLLVNPIITNSEIQDANTLVKTGIHKVYLTDTTLASNNHYPYVHGNLVVISNMEETAYTYIMQLFITTGGITYTRASTNTGATWTEWNESYSAANKPTAVDVGAFKLGGYYAGDMNELDSPGIYRLDSTNTNLPPNAYYGQAMVLRGVESGSGSDTLVQIAGCYSKPDLYYRGARNVDGTWEFTEWGSIYSTSNIMASTTDLEDGVSPLESGKVYYYYEA